MNRRTFLSKTATGSAGLITGVTAASTMFMSDAYSQPGYESDKQIRIGIIGAENTHAAKFGSVFNIEKKYPGVEVKYIWGETEAFAKRTAEQGAIPNIVKDPAEMMGRIDALIVDHRHPTYHLEAALPFVQAGIPTFVDKPFCYRAKKGKAFLEIAQKAGTPVTSFSSIAYSNATLELKSRVDSMSNIEQFVWSGPADIYSKYGGIFFYGVHIVEPMMMVFGEDIDIVKVTHHDRYASAAVIFKSGMEATLVFTKAYHWDVVLITDKEENLYHYKVQDDDTIYYDDIVNMFKTGKEPRSYQSILNGVAVLEALEKSVKSQKWEKVDIQEI